MTQRTAVLAAVIGVVVVVAEPAWRQLSPPPSPTERAVYETEILAKVLLTVGAAGEMCASPDCSVKNPWSGFCISVGDVDPTPELLAKLNRLPAPASPASTCMVASTVGDWRMPPQSHLLLWAKQPHWLSSGLVRVEAGDYLGPLAATGYRVTMLRALGALVDS